MKKMILVILLCLIDVPAWASPKIEIVNIREQVETAMFNFGFMVGIGGTNYLVDRTTHQCFLLIQGSDPHTSVADCKMLEKIPAIKTFLETGKTN